MKRRDAKIYTTTGINFTEEDVKNIKRIEDVLGVANRTEIVRVALNTTAKHLLANLLK